MDDLTGRQFGLWTVLYRNTKKETEVKQKKGYKTIFWHCKCNCGTEQDIIQSNLTGGKTTMCRKHGKTPQNFDNLTGKVFGRLTVMYRDYSEPEKRQTFWKCKCICGNVVSVQAYKLKSGHTRSCGCLQKDIATKTHLIDLTGQRFGKLTVLYRDVDYEKEKDDMQTYWKCLCDCGTEVQIAGGKLTSGWTQSCGCLASYGEWTIRQLLNKEGIDYRGNYIFHDCLGLKNKPLKFDFAIFNNSQLLYVIEFDGIQHFKCSNKGWNTEETFKGVQQRDSIKNEYCWSHNIPLIRIPFHHLKSLTITDLLLPSSSFILTKQNSKTYYESNS